MHIIPTLRKPQEQRIHQTYRPQVQQRNMAPPEADDEFDFPAEVDKIDTVPDALRSVYVKDGATFKLHKGLAEKLDVTPLTSALKKEREKNKAMEKDVAEWKALGLTREEIKERISQQQEDTGTGGDKDKTAKERAKLKSEFEKLIADKEKAANEIIDKKDRALRKHILEGSAQQAISAAKGVSELLMPAVLSQCLLVEEDGVYTVKVVDKAGDPRINGKGAEMTVAELLAEMRQSDVYGRAFEASGKSGSGKPPAAGSGGMPRGDGAISATAKLSRGLSRL